MTGATFQFHQADIVVPPSIIVDSNLVIAKLLTTFHKPRPWIDQAASRFFELLELNDSVGLITSIGLSELLHFAIRARPELREALAQARPR